MVSSLAAQLAQNASLNAALLVDRSRRKPGESYLFTGRDADQHDLESIHALGVNGFLHLASLSASLRIFEDALFSDATKGLDRTLQSADVNAELNRTIAAFLPLLGPYLMEAPTGKVIEWLVRRFRYVIIPRGISLSLPVNAKTSLATRREVVMSNAFQSYHNLIILARINEYNVEDVLVLFLPYHESPHFAKMLTILHIK